KSVNWTNRSKSDDALIGRGSFSRVVRVEHKGTHQPFAIKMMEVEFPEGREVCTTELTVLKRVSHPNIVHMVEVFQFPHRVYMVLELATGGELLDRVVSKGHFTERDATKAIKMVLAAISYLHSLGITHRDLKPENLLDYLASSDSTSVDTSWSLRTTCGTAEYMAPEMVQRKPYWSAVDLWAMGVISFIVLSGSMPFEDDSRTKLYRAIMRGKYSYSGDPWPCVSNLAKDFISGLLRVDPSSRLTAEQAQQHPWVASEAATSSCTNLHRSFPSVGIHPVFLWQRLHNKRHLIKHTGKCDLFYIYILNAVCKTKAALLLIKPAVN
uniref:Protein kinase domain-containing protein n=1 Tax=Periophthalmus magnuspinnatus TaxID=409849 RepID=A0A3B4AEJ6_9GOBI